MHNNKVFREPGVLAQEARWYFAEGAKNGNKITLRGAIRVVLGRYDHFTNEHIVYEIAVGTCICHKSMARKQKQLDFVDLQEVKRAATTPHTVRERLPYKDSDD